MSKIFIGPYEGSVYPEGDGYTGALSLGWTPEGKRKRVKRKGRTKSAVIEKLKEAARDLEAGVRSSANYTVGDAVTDWLAKGLTGRDEQTVTTNRILAEKHVIKRIGKIKLRELRADQVEEWLEKLSVQLATRSLRGVHAILKRSIRHAQARDKVVRNVAELVSTPAGRAGRPSKALTLDQAYAVLDAARVSRLHAYVVLSLMTGVRTEEARALRWTHVVAWMDEQAEWCPVTEVGFDHEQFAVYVWRSVRKGGDTKTKLSRRTLELPQPVIDALSSHHARVAAWRLKAGESWQETGLVFCSPSGTKLDAANVRRAFRLITKKAGLGESWTPRELRHSFVSIMSDKRVPLEEIADMCGHSSTSVTEEVYRQQLKPVIRTGAQTINLVFSPSHRTPKRRRKPDT